MVFNGRPSLEADENPVVPCFYSQFKGTVIHGITVGFFFIRSRESLTLSDCCLFFSYDDEEASRTLGSSPVSTDCGTDGQWRAACRSSCITSISLTWKRSKLYQNRVSQFTNRIRRIRQESPEWSSPRFRLSGHPIPGTLQKGVCAEYRGVEAWWRGDHGRRLDFRLLNSRIRQWHRRQCLV